MERPVLAKNRLIDILPYQLENYPNPKALSDKVTGKWRSYSSAEVMKIVDDLSLGLLKQGVGPKDMVAIISRNRVEWNFVDLAVLQIGGIVVPLYPNTSEDNYAFIFDDTKIKLVFVEDHESLKKSREYAKK